MKRNVKVKAPNNIFVGLVVLSTLIFAVAGCDRYTKHKVLTFFFTGVPPLEEDKKPVTELEKPSKELAEKHKPPPKPVLFSHTPWAAGRCDQCHKGAKGFGVPGQNGTPSVFRKGGGMPGKLVLPKTELCIKCHGYLASSQAFIKRLWLHTPTAKGECNKCHDAHQSKNRYTLLEAPEKVCIPCHTEGNIIKPAEQCKPNECLDCHNPHLGKDRRLLKKDHKETKEPVKPLAL